MGNKLDHKVNTVINEDKLKFLLQQRGWTYKELVERLRNRYGVEIKYKGLVPLFSNKANWKLLYAYILCDLLEVNINDLFDLVESDASSHEILN